MAESLTHPVLGQLRWEDQFSWWLGEACFPSGVRTDLVIDPGDAGASFVDKAAALYQLVLQAESRIRRDATEMGILELYRCWRNDAEPQMSADELANRLEPMFLRIDTVVPITLSYPLGEKNLVFGGHAIDVMIGHELDVRAIELTG